MSPRALFMTVAATLVAALGAVAFPAVASAVVAPKVALVESAGNAAASTSTLGIDIVTFDASNGDAPRDVQIQLPAGLLVNEETDGGGCLTVSAPNPACQIATGTAAIAGSNTPVALYLVSAPTAADLAGIDLVWNSQVTTGELDMTSSAAVGILPSFNVTEVLKLNGLPQSPAFSSLNLTLTGLTFPSACQPANVNVSANSYDSSTLESFAAAFTVTNCLGLQYQPGVLAAISRDTGTISGDAQFTIQDPAGDADTQEVRIKLPPNLSLNPALAPCYEGTICTVGTIRGTSPIIPTSQLTGTIVLSGTQRSPALNFVLPEPMGIEIPSILSSTALTLYQMPDIPMTSLVLNFRGNSLGGLFAVECYATSYEAFLSPRSGATVYQANGTVSVGNCGRPKKKSAHPSKKSSSKKSGSRKSDSNRSDARKSAHSSRHR